MVVHAVLSFTVRGLCRATGTRGISYGTFGDLVYRAEEGINEARRWSVSFGRSDHEPRE